MLTVVVGFDGSVPRRTMRPLASRYSLMPSTLVTDAMPAGSFATGWPLAAGAKRRGSNQRQASKALRRWVMGMGSRWGTPDYGTACRDPERHGKVRPTGVG